MAVANLKKIVLLARASDQQRVVDLLQMSGAVHLTPGEAFLPEETRPFFATPAAAADAPDEEAALEKRLLALQAAIEELESYEQHKGLAARLVQPKECTSLQEFYALARYDEAPVVRRLNELEAQEQALRGQIDDLLDARKPLEALRDVPEPLEAFRDTDRCFVELLRVARSQWDLLASEVEELLGEEGVLFVVTPSHEHVVACAAGWQEKRHLLAEWIETQAVQRLDVSGLQGTAAKNIERLQQTRDTLQQHAAGVAVQRQALLVHLPRLRQVYDYWNTRLEQLRKQNLLRKSHYTALVSGWIREEDIDPLEALLEEHSLDAFLSVENPEPEDEPPVEYANQPLVQPFEFISDLYSRPRYWEIDPTPYLGAFFILFFGICLTDAGYGLLLTLGTYLALRRLPALAPSNRKLIRILLFGGLCTTVVGLLTGGFFGLSFAALPGPLSSLQHAVVLNPMTNQMGFLILTLVLGVVQVAFGIFLKFRWNLRHHRTAEAWLDEAPWLAIIGGAGLLVAARTLDAAWLNSVGVGVLLLAACVILLFAGRAAKNPLKRLALGLFTLYQLSGMFGDVLSYVRLFALGLATGVIASVVNFLAELTLGIPYLGFVVMVFVLVFGHLLNIAINALGGFIHTTRLQFVEFFGKFYEGGGTAFDAFRIKTKYTKVLDLR